MKTKLNNLKSHLKIKSKEYGNQYREFNQFLGKNLALIFSSVFRSFRTYVYAYIIPIAVLIVLYTYQSFGGVDSLLPPIVAGYLLIPTFGVAILINAIISEWKASIFLKRIHIMGTTKWNFLLSIWIVGYVLGMSAFVLGCLIMLALGPVINVNQGNLFIETFSFFNYGTSSQIFMSWFGFFLGASIITLSGLGIATLVAGAVKSLALSQSIVIIIIFVSVPMSDLFLGPTVMSESKTVTIISYFIPQKYGVWTTFLAVSNGNLNYIVPNPAGVKISVSFNNIYGPIFGGLSYTLVLMLLSWLTFRWSNRG